MFRKIIIATDGSVRSNRVAKTAGYLAGIGQNCEIYVLFVALELPPEVSTMLKEADISYTAQITVSANAILARTVDAMCLTDETIKVHTVRKFG
ncbi:MAG: universal stress protein, partial [Firmicutes bacterium]|nr:universal stress protein [Bacillota bacterium]